MEMANLGKDKAIDLNPNSVKFTVNFKFLKKFGATPPASRA